MDFELEKESDNNTAMQSQKAVTVTVSEIMFLKAQ